MKVIGLFLILLITVGCKDYFIEEKLENFKPHTKNDLMDSNIKKDLNDDMIESEFRRLEKKIREGNLNVAELKKKGIELKDLTMLMDSYLKLKKNKSKNTKVKKNDHLSTIMRFKERNSNKEEKNVLNKEINLKSNSTQNCSELQGGNKTQDTTAFFSALEKTQAESTRIKMFPYNLAITKPEEVLKKTKGKGTKKVYLDSRLLTKMLADKSLGENVVTKAIPLEECNRNWDYTLHGEDWVCMCQCGKNQSPINIITSGVPTSHRKEESFYMKQTNSRIFFDFVDPEISCAEGDASCKYPLIRNSGSSLDIETDCGVLVMPPHMNGYKCVKLEIHTPGEHKIDSKSFEMEIHVIFKLSDKRIVDQYTKDYIILVILVKGIDTQNLSEGKKNMLKNHPFLDLMELDSIPNKKGHARMLKKFLDFNLIFDESKQPYQKREKETKKTDSPTAGTMKFLEVSSHSLSSSRVEMAINDLTYDRYHPLKEFYLYNGSFTRPPCDEIVHYIVNPQPIFAPMSQIIKFSKVILDSGNQSGNNREIQALQGRYIFHFQDNGKLVNSIKYMDLKDDLLFSKYPNEKSSDYEVAESDGLIDKIIDRKNSLNNILALANLR